MRLLLRHATASWGPSALVAAIVALVVLIAALAPRALALVSTQELRAQVESIASEARDLTATGVGASVTVLPPEVPPDADAAEQQAALDAWYGLTVADVYEPMDAELARLRDEQPPALREALGAPDYYSRSEAFATNPDEPERDAPLMLTRLATDPRIEERVRIVEGEFPERARFEVDAPLELMLSVDAADDLRWEVGEVRDRAGVPVVLSGTFAAADEAAPYWRHAPSVLQPQLFDDGNSTPQVTAVAYLNPLTTFLNASGQRTTVWYPIEVDALSFAEAETLAPALRSFTDRPHLVPALDDRRPGLSLGFASALEPALDTVIGRAATTTALLALLASGPLGVALAVLTLGARVVVERRRAALSLAAARGASGFQLRGAMALEGAVVGIVPAVAATAVAAVLIPAPVGPAEVVVPALLGLAPAIIFGAVTVPSGLRPVRADLAASGSGRRRWILEAIVVLLAAVALVLLLRRGLTTSGGVVDPLLAATPLLLSLAVCVIVLRLYPLPLGWIAARVRRGRGLAGFLGSARALRDRSLALEAVLALVVAVAVGVFSSVLLSTVDRGIEAGALAAVGADVRASGPVFEPETIAAASRLAGVEAVSGIDVAAPVDFRVDDVRSTLQLIVVDAASLSAFRTLPDGLDVRQGDAVPIVVSQDVVDSGASDGELQIEGIPVVVVGSAPREGGLGVRNSWAIVDRAFAQELTGNDYLPQSLLVATEPGADLPAILSALTDLGGPSTSATSLTEAVESAQSAPATAGLRAALLVAVLVAVVLAAIAVVLSTAIGASSRQRVTGLLRTLGATERQQRAVIVWEFIPSVTSAGIAGTLLGLGLPWIVTAVVDLRPFTGGSSQPAPAGDPLLIAAVLGAVLVTVAAAVAVAIGLARRTTLTTTLRMGAD